MDTAPALESLVREHSPLLPSNTAALGVAARPRPACMCSDCDSELTKIATPPSSRVDDAATIQATRLMPPDATRLSIADATRMSTADATRLAGPTRQAWRRAGDDLTPAAGTAGAPASPGTAATGPLTIGDRFGRYTIMRLLGIGGMGAVYQAWDEELDVVVALKVIRPEVLRDPAAEQEIERRFKRELLLARQVTHKNVVRIHDLGEIDGIKYITMSYVARHGPRDAREARGAAAGAADSPHHAVGRVGAGRRARRRRRPSRSEAGEHHDRRRRRSADHGLRHRAVDRRRGRTCRCRRAPLARTGSTVCARAATPTRRCSAPSSARVEYMAPEQASGQAVDQRADVYAVGLILYDLLTGKKRAERHRATRSSSCAPGWSAALPPIKSLAPDVPDALAAIVMRASETDAAKRFQTTAELAEALERARRQRRAAAGEARRRRADDGRHRRGRHRCWRRGAGGSSGRPVPEAPHDPVSVVIADFENRTGDPTFDRTLEPMLKRALEGAGFITAYDRNGIRRTFGARPCRRSSTKPPARELAVKQGLGVVLSGADRASRAAATRVDEGDADGDRARSVRPSSGRASSQDQVVDDRDEARRAGAQGAR